MQGRQTLDVVTTLDPNLGEEEAVGFIVLPFGGEVIEVGYIAQGIADELALGANVAVDIVAAATSLNEDASQILSLSGTIWSINLARVSVTGRPYLKSVSTLKDEFIVGAETLTPYEWLGERVYRKIIDVGVWPDANRNQAVAHGISDLKSWFRLRGIVTGAGANLPTDGVASPNGFNYMSGDHCNSIWADATNIHFNAYTGNSNWINDWHVWVIAEYLKNTEAPAVAFPPDQSHIGRYTAAPGERIRFKVTNGGKRERKGKFQALIDLPNRTTDSDRDVALTDAKAGASK